MRRGALVAVTLLCLLGCEAEAPEPTPRTNAAPRLPAGKLQDTRTPSGSTALAPAPRTTAAPPLPEGKVQITRTPSGYSVRANDALPFEALAALGEAAGFRTEHAAGAPEGAPLRLALESVPLEDALAAILAGIPHQVHYEFADGDLSPERPFEGRPVVLARVSVGALPASRGEAKAAAALPAGRRGPPPPAEGERSAKRAGREDDGERARQREEAEALEREREETVARQWNDPRASARLEAIERMEPEGEDRARLETLLREDVSPEVRIAAAESLAEGDAFQVMEPLLAALGDPDPSVVAAVVRGLEDVYSDAPNPRIRERVAELREHRDPGVREAVANFEEWIEE